MKKTSELVPLTGKKDGDNSEKIEPPKDGLSMIHVAAYSVGHFCNDLCASMWFIYFVWYVKEVIGRTETIAASAVLSG